MKRISIAVGFAFIIIICAIFFNVNNSYFNCRMPTSVLEKAEYNDDDVQDNAQKKVLWMKENDNQSWNNFNIPGTPSDNRSNEYIWIRVKMPNNIYKDPCIFFYTYNQQFEVYIDGKQIYSFGDMKQTKGARLPGSLWHIIELPENYADKYVYFHMHSVIKSNSGLIRNLEVSSRINFITNIIRQEIVTFILAVMFIFIGCSIIIVTALTSFKNTKLCVYFGLCCICAGVWIVAEGKIKQLFFSAPEFWEYLKITSQYMIPVYFGLLIDCLAELKMKLLCKVTIWFHMVLLILSYILDLLNIAPINSTLPVFYCSFTLSTIAVILLMVRNYENWNSEVKISSFGFAMLCGIGIFDVVNWNFNPKYNDIYSTQWGIFLLLISLLIAIIHHFINAQDKIDEYSEEIKYKDRKITENMQQLEFFSNISHELRTPINIILSTIQLIKLLLKDGAIIEVKGKNLNKYCDGMKQNCLRLLKLVNNLIDMNKIDSGYLKPEFSNNDIVSAIENITQSVACYTKSRGIEVIFDTNVEEKNFSFDTEKLERIMLNLLSNAVKFSKPGATIYVDIIDEGKNVVIKVKDTGIGIKEDKIDQIFDRFVQVDKSLSRDHEGSGIGLSLVKALVNMHDGTITCESEYGKGSTFTVTLPVRLIDQSVEAYDTSDLNNAHKEKINIEFSDI